MNPLLKNIFSRRSVRSYIKNKPIPQDTQQDILEAAMAAPTTCNKKPYEIIVIDKPEILKKVTEVLPYGKFLKDASLGMIVCGDINQAHDQQIPYLLQDCSAVIENLLISVSILNLGGCWLGVYPRENRINGIKDIFNLPSNIIPVSVVSIGYPAEKPPPPRTQYTELKVHTNMW